jgi:hypothetical protein
LSIHSANLNIRTDYRIPVMNFWRIVALGCLLTAIAPGSHAQDGRFSRTLTAAEVTDAGLERLSADQLAVLDALIRRDEKINPASDSAHPAPTRFSQRLSPEQRTSAGLDSLNEVELARLDAMAQRRASGSLQVVASKVARPAMQPESSGPAPEIHGTISFTFGGGRGGYREKGGFMMLDYQDPAHGLELLVGYGEMRISGPTIYRNFDGRPVR